jgi:hypothetical protein
MHVVPPVLLLAVVAAHWSGGDDLPRDTFAYYRGAEAAAAGAGIYDPVPAPGPHEFRGAQHFHYLYPPPLAAMLAPAARIGYRAFDRAWLVLDILAVVALAAALARIARGTWSLDGTARWGAAVLVPGPILAVHFGNIELLVLALVAVGLAVPSTAGAAVGLAAMFKVTPVWPLAVLAARRPRRVLPGLAIASAVAGGACVLVFGAAGTLALSLQWAREIAPVMAQGQFWGGSLAAVQQGVLRPLDFFTNLSISFLPVQLAVLTGWWDYQGGPLPSHVRMYLTAVALGAALLVAWLARRRAPTVQAAAVLVAALFAAPIVRPYALAAWLLLLAAVRGERLRPARPDRAAGPGVGVEHGKPA